MIKKTKLGPAERDQIACLLAGGLRLGEIAGRLGRSKSTICDEVHRNGGPGGYVATGAQAKADRRKFLGRQKNRAPLRGAVIYAHVLEKLREGWSPEQISGRLEKETGKKVIHFETIYRYIYAPKNRSRRFWEYLPLKKVRRRKKFGRASHRERIPNRVSIHLRGPIVESRTEYGHWEGDTVVGRQEKGPVIHTEVERKTRFLIAVLVRSKESSQTLLAQQTVFGQYPCKSVTTDNGLEFVQHESLWAMGIKTYFADSYASWQRGTNEYHNGLLRRYLPKKTGFENLTQEELDDIVWEINNRPRKALGYKTPIEMLESELVNPSVRIQSRM